MNFGGFRIWGATWQKKTVKPPLAYSAGRQTPYLGEQQLDNPPFYVHDLGAMQPGRPPSTVNPTRSSCSRHLTLFFIHDVPPGLRTCLGGCGSNITQSLRDFLAGLVGARNPESLGAEGREVVATPSTSLHLPSSLIVHWLTFTVYCRGAQVLHGRSLGHRTRKTRSCWPAQVSVLSISFSLHQPFDDTAHCCKWGPARNP